MRIIKEGELQDYQSWYLLYRDELTGGGNGGGGGGTGGSKGTEGLEFEMELINQVDIDIPYILALVKKYHDSNCEDSELLKSIIRSVTSSPHLREKKDIIDGFIQTVKPNTDIDIFDEWQKFVAGKREEELSEIINAEKLKEANARNFIDKALRDGYVEENGMEITKVLPPMPVFVAIFIPKYPLKPEKIPPVKKANGIKILTKSN